jgi:hypothetical protein
MVGFYYFVAASSGGIAGRSRGFVVRSGIFADRSGGFAARSSSCTFEPAASVSRTMSVSPQNVGLYSARSA